MHPYLTTPYDLSAAITHGARATEAAQHRNDAFRHDDATTGRPVRLATYEGDGFWGYVLRDADYGWCGAGDGFASCDAAVHAGQRVIDRDCLWALAEHELATVGVAHLFPELVA